MYVGLYVAKGLHEAPSKGPSEAPSKGPSEAPSKGHSEVPSNGPCEGPLPHTYTHCTFQGYSNRYRGCFASEGTS